MASTTLTGNSKIRSRSLSGSDQLPPVFRLNKKVSREKKKRGPKEKKKTQKKKRGPVQYYSALLFRFNPMVDSLRAIQRASELKKVQQRLGCSRTSLVILKRRVDFQSVRRSQSVRG